MPAEANVPATDLRRHHALGRVEMLASSDAFGIVRYRAMEGVTVLTCTLAMWERWPVWQDDPDLDHLPLGAVGGWGCGA